MKKHTSRHSRFALALVVAASTLLPSVALADRVLEVNPEADLSLLQRAMEGGMKVTPRYKDGQGITKCLVGFRISSN